MKAVSNFYKLSFSRPLAILVALSFVPVFSYGFLSVWIFISCIFIALHFRFLLLQIIDQYLSPLQSNDPAHISRLLYKKLPLAILECAALIAVVPLLLAIYSGHHTLAFPATSESGDFFAVFNPAFINTENKQIPSASAAIAVVLYNQSWFMILAIFILALKPLWQILNRFFYREIITNPGFEADPAKKRKYARQFSHYDLLSGFYTLTAGLAIAIQIGLLDYVLDAGDNTLLSIVFSAICGSLICEIFLLMWIVTSRR